MSASEDTGSSIPTDTSPEALEAAEVAWYDDLDMTTVFVAGFVSTVATIIIIAVVQGLYYQWQNDAIRAVEVETYISPAQAIVNAQKETLDEGVLPVSLTTGRIDGEMYYPKADQRVLISLEAAKQKVMKEMGGATN